MYKNELVMMNIAESCQKEKPESERLEFKADQHGWIKVYFEGLRVGYTHPTTLMTFTDAFNAGREHEQKKKGI